MDMIGLKRSLYQVPPLLSDDFINDLLQLFLNWPNQHSLPPFRASDDTRLSGRCVDHADSPRFPHDMYGELVNLRGYFCSGGGDCLARSIRRWM